MDQIRPADQILFEADLTMGNTKKILIVDDEQDILTYVEALLEDSGYDTVSAKDGIEGFERAQSEKPDLIILDVTMPRQSGLKTYRQYKGHSTLKNTPVIIITAVEASFKTFIDAHKAFSPPEGIFSKPFDPSKLLELVADILSD